MLNQTHTVKRHRDDDRQALKIHAQKMTVRVLIGHAGLTEAVIKEVDTQLTSRGCVKARALSSAADYKNWWQQIATQLHAEIILALGHTATFYRPLPDTDAHADTKGSGLRKVTVVKRSKDPTRPPHKKTLLLKSNERLSAGGLVKRLRRRPASKKRHVVV